MIDAACIRQIRQVINRHTCSNLILRRVQLMRSGGVMMLLSLAVLSRPRRPRFLWRCYDMFLLLPFTPETDEEAEKRGVKFEEGLSTHLTYV